MILRVSAPPLLDAEHAGFILLPGISITAASRTAGMVPELGRAHGCRMAPDRRRAVVLLPGDQYPALIGALRESRAIAVVFSQPSTHRTIQLKGGDASFVPVDGRDLALIRAQIDAKVWELVPLGYAEGLVRSVFHGEPEDIVGVSFTPNAAFMQTPGPKAGMPLHS
jgi:hypothetical protein